jgi:hypothetical protein
MTPPFGSGRPTQEAHRVDLAQCPLPTPSKPMDPQCRSALDPGSGRPRNVPTVRAYVDNTRLLRLNEMGKGSGRTDLSVQDIASSSTRSCRRGPPARTSHIAPHGPSSTCTRRRRRSWTTPTPRSLSSARCTRSSAWNRSALYRGTGRRPSFRASCSPLRRGRVAPCRAHLRWRGIALRRCRGTGTLPR